MSADVDDPGGLWGSTRTTAYIFTRSEATTSQPRAPLFKFYEKKPTTPIIWSESAEPKTNAIFLTFPPPPFAPKRIISLFSTLILLVSLSSFYTGCNFNWKPGDLETPEFDTE